MTMDFYRTSIKENVGNWNCSVVPVEEERRKRILLFRRRRSSRRRSKKKVYREGGAFPGEEVILACISSVAKLRARSTCQISPSKMS